MIDHGLFDVRAKESFLFSMEISKPYGHIDDILIWSKSELLGAWRWQLIDVSTDHRPGRYVWYFDLDRDYFAFTLKWA